LKRLKNQLILFLSHSHENCKDIEIRREGYWEMKTQEDLEIEECLEILELGRQPREYAIEWPQHNWRSKAPLPFVWVGAFDRLQVIALEPDYALAPS